MMPIELATKSDYEIETKISVWQYIDYSLPDGFKRIDLLSSPVCGDLARQCAHIDKEKAQIYIAPIIGTKLFFTEQINEWLRQQGATCENAIALGDTNLQAMLNMDLEEHKAIFEIMLNEILHPTAPTPTLLAWKNDGCREKCGNYPVPEKNRQQVLTTTTWVYQQGYASVRSQTASSSRPPRLPTPAASGARSSGSSGCSSGQAGRQAAGANNNEIQWQGIATPGSSRDSTRGWWKPIPWRCKESQW